MNYTLDQLRALDAIDRTGSFADAAKTLHKVPSAVSYLVKELESGLGVAIFDRTRRKATLTPQGRTVLTAARALLSEAHTLERTIAELQAGWEPQLHVVVDGALPMEPITACIRRFSDPTIPTALRVDVEYQEGVIELFERSEAEIGLVIGFKGDGDDAGYTSEVLPDLPLVLVASAAHPMATEAIDDALKALHAELVVRDSSQKYARMPKPSYFGSRNVVYLSDFHAKRTALVGGAGYGWIPRHFVETDLAEGRLVLLDTEPNSWTYAPRIITRAPAQGKAPLGRAGMLFLEVLRGGLED